MHATMHAASGAGKSPTASAEYWGRIFKHNPDFCSWQAPKQKHVKQALRECLCEPPGVVRVLDFGIGSVGLYRSFEDDLMRRIVLTGVSESRQHDLADPFLARHHIEIAIGPGVSPLAAVPASSQDRVVSSYVFDYLSDEIRADALRAFARVMVGGAKLTLVLHHPRGQRAQKFRRSEPYWQEARACYERLLEGRYAEASALFQSSMLWLDAVFAHDQRYRSYLASYLKTAERFLSLFCVDGRCVHEVPEAALADCQRTMRLIDRELAMTCQSLRPIELPASQLTLPPELTLSNLVECADPTDGCPIAHVLTAVRRVARE